MIMSRLAISFCAFSQFISCILALYTIQILTYASRANVLLFRARCSSSFAFPSALPSSHSLFYYYVYMSLSIAHSYVWTWPPFLRFAPPCSAHAAQTALLSLRFDCPSISYSSFAYTDSMLRLLHLGCIAHPSTILSFYARDYTTTIYVYFILLYYYVYLMYSNNNIYFIYKSQKKVNIIYIYLCIYYIYIYIYIT